MNLERYLENNSHCMSIQKNKTHRQSSSLQFKKDNQTILTLVKNAHVHEQSKHIDVVYHHIYNLHLKNKIEMFFMFSINIIADELIKFLSRQMFKCFVYQLKLDDNKS